MSLDLNLLRGAVTLVSFIGFIVLVLHTYNRHRQAEHDAAAALPFSDQLSDQLSDAQGVNRE